MKPENARLIANTIVFAAGGVLAVLALRQPLVRRVTFRMLPLLLGGATPLHAATIALSQAAFVRSNAPASSTRGPSPQTRV